MRIAYVTTYNPMDIHQWSGTGYHIRQSLIEQQLEVINIDNLSIKKVDYVRGGAKKIYYQNIKKQNYLWDRNPLILQNYALQVEKSLAGKQYDLILSPGTIPITFLRMNKPIVFYSDATFAGMVGFYPEFSNLCNESIVYGNEMEKQALENCSLAIYASDWAAQTAMDYYGISPSKISVVPFGANIEFNWDKERVKAAINARPRNRCKLLFMGVDWNRKGGSIAYRVCKRLNEMGLSTELTIVGCEPLIEEPLPEYIRSLGFISKSTTEGEELIKKLLSESHFLIMPTRAECAGIVFCEASAYGLPSITCDVGGVSTYVKSGVNGKVFSKETDIEEYCKYIYELFSENYTEYIELAGNSFEEYQTRLNWNVSGSRIKSMLEELQNIGL